MPRFSKLNKEVKKWNKNTEGFEYKKLKDYLEETGAETIKVYGFFINNLENGDAVTIIADDCYINMPSHCVETFKSFGDADKDAINDGKLALGNFRKTVIKRFKQETIYFDYLDVE